MADGNSLPMIQNLSFCFWETLPTLYFSSAKLPIKKLCSGLYKAVVTNMGKRNDLEVTFEDILQFSGNNNELDATVKNSFISLPKYFDHLIKILAKGGTHQSLS